MMYSEFVDLVGKEMPYGDFEKAEKIYMNSFVTKKEIADLYKSCPNTVYNLCGMAEKAEKSESLVKNLTETEKKAAYFKKTTSRYLHELDDAEETSDRLMETIRSQRDAVDRLSTENEELRTQLHQYRALFADIEKSMTVSLYSALLGIEK